MTTTEPRTIIELNCPSWCIGDHLFDDDSAQGGGVTVDHVSETLDWADHCAAWISRTDGYTPEHLPADIHVGGHIDEVAPITADEARRLAAVLVQLADELERG